MPHPLHVEVSSVVVSAVVEMSAVNKVSSVAGAAADDEDDAATAVVEVGDAVAGDGSAGGAF